MKYARNWAVRRTRGISRISTYSLNLRKLPFLYDKATRKVTAISIDFMNGASEVITPQQVFGADVEAKPDGSKYKLVRYPKAGLLGFVQPHGG